MREARAAPGLRPLSSEAENMSVAERSVWTSPRERVETRRLLVDAARALVARKGEQALTLSAVAAEAGFARATIYGYFSGKNELLAALELQVVRPALELVSHRVAEPGTVVAFPIQIDTHVVPAKMSAPPEMEPAAAPEARDAAPEPDAPAMAPPEDTTSPAEETPQAAEESATEQPLAEPASDAIVASSEMEHAAAVLSAEGGVEAAGDQSDASHVSTDNADVALPEHQTPPADTPPEPFSSTEDAAAPDEARAVPSSDQDEPATAADDAAGEIVTPYEQGRRLQAMQLDEIAKRLVLPESALKEGTDAVISRLETRIRVLERTLAALEARQNAAAGEGEKKLKPVSDLVEQLQARTESSESRQLQSISELRLGIHELTTRLNAIDPPQRGALSGALSWPSAAAEPAAPEADAFVPQADNAQIQPEHGTAATDTSRHAYLSAVRDLAKEGARQAAERESLYEKEQKSRRRRLMMAGGVAVLCLGVVGVLYAIHPGPQGVSTAQSKAMPPAAAHAAARTLHAAVTPHAPLDRLTALADKGDARAELLVGLKYLTGDGIAANDAEAAHWLERAALQGDPIAQNHLGALYQNGRGVAANIAQAMHWYEAAAIQGDRHAMSNLAVLYAGGAGVRKNFAEAARWFQRSASLGYVDAQFNLAVLFERGDGVPQSLLDAYKWYAIAAAAGDAVAKTRADAIATQISPDELQAARDAVANFKPLPLNHAANDVPTMSDVLAAR